MGGYGRIWEDMGGHGRIWEDMGGHVEDMGGYGRIWEDMEGDILHILKSCRTTVLHIPISNCTVHVCTYMW